MTQRWKSILFMLVAALFALCLVPARALAAVQPPTQTFTLGATENDDSLIEGYINQRFSVEKPGDGVMLRGRPSVGLTGNDLAVYNLLKPMIAEVAAGERTSTVFVIDPADICGQSYFTADDLGVSDVFSDEAFSLMYDRITFNLTTVVGALLADCPYELYWFDKCIEFGSSYPAACSMYIGSEPVLCFDEETPFTISLPVSADYSKTGAMGTFETDPTTGQRVSTAVATAAGIVADTEGSVAISRLQAFKDEICDLVDYNYDALEDESMPYGDPWQLVNVFDGDDTTKVVCEGYSKAFQYLCDLASISRVECYTVYGEMRGGTGAGPHMWNLVDMDDNEVYLVDVTNCDAGSVGYYNELFLVPYDSGSVASGYTFKPNGSTIKYVYDEDMYALYSEDALTVSSTEYAGPTEPDPGEYDWEQFHSCGFELVPEDPTLFDGIVLWVDHAYSNPSCDWEYIETIVQAAYAASGLTGVRSNTWGIDDVYLAVKGTEGAERVDLTLAENAALANSRATLRFGSVDNVDNTAILRDDLASVTCTPVEFTAVPIEVTDVSGNTYTAYNLEITGKLSDLMDVYTIIQSDPFDVPHQMYSNTDERMHDYYCITANNSAHTSFEGVSTDSVDDLINPLRMTTVDQSLRLYFDAEYGFKFIAPVEKGYVLDAVTYTANGVTTTLEPIGEQAMSTEDWEDYDVYFVPPVSAPVTVTITAHELQHTVNADGTVTFENDVLPTAYLLSFDLPEGVYFDYADDFEMEGYRPPFGVENPASTVTDGVDYYCWPDAQSCFLFELPDGYVITNATLTPASAGTIAKVGSAGYVYLTLNAPATLTLEVAELTYSQPDENEATGISVTVADLEHERVDGLTLSATKVEDAAVADELVDLMLRYFAWREGEDYSHDEVVIYDIWYVDAEGNPVNVGFTGNDGFTYNARFSIPVPDGWNADETHLYYFDGYGPFDGDPRIYYAKGFTASEDGSSIEFDYHYLGRYALCRETPAGKTDISGATLTVADQEWTGEALTPAVTVTLGGKTLVAGTDYRIVYKDNIAPGTATVTVSGLGDYTGFASTTFEITAPGKIDISGATVTAPQQTYTGAALTPAVTVKLGSATLSPGSDYTVVYANNTAIGTATVTVTGKGDYEGTATGTFEIVAPPKTDISKATIAAIADQTYTGSAIKPAVTVTLNGKTLVAGTDYSVEYANNTAVGTATLTVTGKGDYEGSVTGTFKIVAPAHPSGWSYETDGTYYYDENGQLKKDYWLQEGSDYYYFDKSGKLVTDNWVQAGSKWYYMDEEGKLVWTGVSQYQGKYYWVNKGTVMTSAQGWKTYKGAYYLFNGSYGSAYTKQWYKYGNAYYYFGADGKLVINGWATYGKNYFYMGANGQPVTNTWLTINGAQYHFNASGICDDVIGVG